MLEDDQGSACANPNIGLNSLIIPLSLLPTLIGSRLRVQHFLYPQASSLIEEKTVKLRWKIPNRQ
jgi:hypothetical protein